MIKTSILTAALAFASMVLWTSTGEAAEIKAANVSSVRYQDPDTGQLVQINRFGQNNNKFQEHSPNGIFTFNVVRRDEWTVYLYDPARQMSMTIDLHEKKLTWGRGANQGQIDNAIGSYAIHSFQ